MGKGLLRVCVHSSPSVISVGSACPVASGNGTGVRDYSCVFCLPVRRTQTGALFTPFTQFTQLNPLLLFHH